MKLHLAYHKEKTTIAVGREIVEVKAFQIIVWVSISIRGILEWDETIPKFPAILDIGNTHNLGISEEQLRKWGGIHPDSLPQMKPMRVNKQLVPIRAASVWLHMDHAPYELSVEQGIGVYTEGGTRLPILGLRALTNSKLQTLIYGDQLRAVIQTPRKWYWPL